MIEVTAKRKGQQVQVRLHGFDRLTPRAAHAAMEVAFGGSTGGGEVWWSPPIDPAKPEQAMLESYGYRVYANSARKIGLEL